MKRQPFTILLHIALAIILAGAIVTHFFGIQGTLMLSAEAPAVSMFEQSSGPGHGEFPFAVSLSRVEIIYYPATTTPMDFRSEIEIDGRQLTVAMNQVGEYNGWRFYQSGIGPDYSVFSISHDPWGIGLTYTSYALLGIGMLGFFFQKRPAWRS
ncbi:MAG: cytochrome c biogenesis protein ResB, partial [Muribaculaceae bacterium]|nr:cytochrome c biogenesis protein ResB [Muribaculaceae bacterium]